MRILWEACIRVPDFPRAAEACVAVLHRVADSEESIQDLVGKVFHGLWFASKREGLSRALVTSLASAAPSMQPQTCKPRDVCWLVKPLLPLVQMTKDLVSGRVLSNDLLKHTSGCRE